VLIDCFLIVSSVWRRDDNVFSFQALDWSFYFSSVLSLVDICFSESSWAEYQQNNSRSPGAKRLSSNEQRIGAQKADGKLTTIVWGSVSQFISDIGENKMLFNASRYQHIQLDIKVNGQWLLRKWIYNCF